MGDICEMCGEEVGFSINSFDPYWVFHSRGKNYYYCEDCMRKNCPKTDDLLAVSGLE